MSVSTRVLGALLLCTCLSAQTRLGISGADWGTTVRGEKVAIYTLAGAGGLEARISNFGGVIVTLNVPNRNGSKTDVMLGYDDLASYEKGGVYGAVIGRYANRIGSNGSFPLDGKTIQLERASPDQKIVIHGGTAGFQKKVWHAQMHDGAEPSLELTVVSPDGDGGFPGALTTTLVYTVTRDNELMLDYWPKGEDDPAATPAMREFSRIWKDKPKIVFSRTLPEVSSASTRIERDFDRDAVRRLKQSSTADISIGGAELAGQAIRAGLVDECHLFLCPMVVGGGKRALSDNVRAQLELLDERRFPSGFVHLHYRVII